MAANNRIPITVGDRVDTSTLFFERTEQHGLLVAAQAVWKGPLGSCAAGEIKDADMTKPYKKVAASDADLLVKASLRYPLDAEPKVQLGCSPQQVMRIFTSGSTQMGNTNAGKRAMLVASFIEPLSTLIREAPPLGLAALAPPPRRAPDATSAVPGVLCVSRMAPLPR